MEKKSINLKLYAITDERWLNGCTLEEQVLGLIEGGITCLQYRDKESNDEDKKEKALNIRKLCKMKGITFILNDDVLLAKEIDADGVHLGQQDINPKEARKILGEHRIIGVSARTKELAQEAEQRGADYIGCGAVFGTNTKDDAKFLGIEALKEICNSVDLPVVAIGGITSENISKLQGSGIAGVAVVSELFSATNPQKVARLLATQMDQLKKGGR